MKSQKFRIAKSSKWPVVTMVCALFILFFEFCTINVMSGEFSFTYRFPLHFGGSGFDMCESAVVVCIPVFLLILTYFYAKKNLKILCWPLAIFILRVLVQVGYLWAYEGHLSLKETGVDLGVYGLLFLVFALTVFGKVDSKWWLVGVCGAFIVMEIVNIFVPAASYSFVVGTSFYLSTFLSYTLFFVAYGALGLAMERNGKPQ